MTFRAARRVAARGAFRNWQTTMKNRSLSRKAKPRMGAKIRRFTPAEDRRIALLAADGRAITSLAEKVSAYVGREVEPALC